MIDNAAEIGQWLQDNNITKYLINEDLSVDVNQTVVLTNSDLKELPVQFNSIQGALYLNNNKLITLKGCPKKVNSHFIIEHNELVSLEHCPEIIGGHFECHYNKLESLKHGPKSVGRNYVCSHNYLKSLEHCPETIIANFDCGSNYIEDLKYLPSFIGGNLYVSYQDIMLIRNFNTTLNGTFNHVVENHDWKAGNVIRNLKDYYEFNGSKYIVTLSGKELSSIIMHQKLSKSVPNKEIDITKKNKI